MTENTPPAIDTRAIAHWRARQLPAWLHQEIARRMAEQLPLVKAQPQAWCQWPAQFDGSAELLIGQYPKAQGLLVGSEAACAQIIDQVQRREPWWRIRSRKPVLMHCTPQAMPAGEAELVWSNMALHFAVDSLAQMRDWVRALRLGGFIMFSCVGPDTLKELRSIYEQYGWGPATVGFTDMHDLGDMMLAAGFTDPVMDMEYIDLRWNSIEAMLGELRTLGVNAHPERFAGLRTRHWKDQLLEALESLVSYDAQGNICYSITFEVIYGHAFKLTSGVRMDNKTTVGLEDMRALLHRKRSLG